MNCCICGTPITNDSVFCPHCGAKQDAGNSASSSSWFSPASNFDDSPIFEKKPTQPTEAPAAAPTPFLKPVKGIKEPSKPKVHAHGTPTAPATPATPVTYANPEKPKAAPPIKPAESAKPKTAVPIEPVVPANPISKPATHNVPKFGNGTASKAWSKYAIMAVAVVAVIVVIFAVVGSINNSPAFDDGHIGSAKGGNYYTVEQARQVIIEKGYALEDDIEARSEDGYFTYEGTLATENFNFVTISGYVEFTAEYDEGRWITHVKPQVNYDWKLSGSWYADTEHYDVYMDIKSYTGSNLRLVLEAQFDSIEGGKGTYNEQDQMVTLRFVDDDYRKENSIYDVYLYCEVSGGYPLFQLRIDKDTMTIWQTHDNYKAEFVPN